MKKLVHLSLFLAQTAKFQTSNERTNSAILKIAQDLKNVLNATTFSRIRKCIHVSKLWMFEWKKWMKEL